MAGEREINEKLFESMRRADETFDEMGNIGKPAPLIQGTFEFPEEVPVIETTKEEVTTPRGNG